MMRVCVGLLFCVVGAAEAAKSLNDETIREAVNLWLHRITTRVAKKKGGRPKKGGGVRVLRLSPCVLVQPNGWARGEREGYGGPRDVTSLSLHWEGYGEPRDVTINVTYSAASTAAGGNASPDARRTRTRADAWSDAASFADRKLSANVAAPKVRYAAAAAGTDLAATVGATTIASGVSETQAARKRAAKSRPGAPQ